MTKKEKAIIQKWERKLYNAYNESNWTNGDKLCEAWITVYELMQELGITHDTREA